MSNYKITLRRVPNFDSRPTNWQEFEVYIDELYYCEAHALIFAVGSEYGIEGGRISKLFCFHRPPMMPRGYAGVHEIAYDRGEWRTRPDNPKAKAVLDYFISHPPKFIDFS